MSSNKHLAIFVFLILILQGLPSLSLAASGDTATGQNNWESSPIAYNMLENGSVGPPTGQSGTISGSIIDEASSQELSNIPVYARLTRNFTVEAYDAETNKKNGQTRIIPVNLKIYKTMSSANGSYSINDLPIGLYKIWVGEPDSPYLTQYYNTTTEKDAVPIMVRTGVVGINFQLITGGIISGSVHRSIDNQIIAGATVAAYTNGKSVATTTSKEDGSYILQGLANGSYTIKAGKSREYVDFYFGGNGDKATAVQVESSPGSVTNDINFSLQQTGSISGKVIYEGHNLPGITIIAYPSGVSLVPNPPRQIQRTLTDSNGRYVLSGLKPDSYTVVASPRDNFAPEAYGSTNLWDENLATQVRAGEQTGSIDFTLTLGATIQGSVISEQSGAPIADGQITVFEAVTGKKISQISSNAQGFFSFDKLATATYLLQIKSGQYDNEFFDNALNIESATKISVSPGMVAMPIEIKLTGEKPDYKGEISGKLTWDKDQSYIQNACVHAFEYASQSEKGSACSGADGTYMISGLATGEYRLCARSRGGYISECFENTPLQARTLATPITIVDENKVSGIDFALQKFGSISGSVFGSENNTLGTYEIKNLKPGRYLLKIIATGTGYQGGYYQNATSLSNATEVLVEDGLPHEDINFKLPVE